MGERLSVTIESKSRGVFKGFIEAISYQKNYVNKLISCRIFGVENLSYINSLFNDVTKLTIDNQVIYPCGVI